MLYLHPQRPEGGVWQPGQQREVLPVVMFRGDGEWRVDNFGSEEALSLG